MRNLLIGVAAASLALAATAAHADNVNATFAIQYFKVANSTDPDFSGPNPTVMDMSSLGTHGMPVGTGVNDLGGGDSEITWWDPALNSHVTTDGTGAVSLPINTNMYFPHGTGSDDSLFYETAILTGDFTLGSSATVSFNLGSDDDVFIYVDGTLFGQNPGIHGVTNVNFSTPLLDAGAHQVEVFYADRERTGAFLSLDLNSTGVVITAPGVPEPATWALMMVGFGGLGATLRRRRTALAATA